MGLFKNLLNKKSDKLNADSKIYSPLAGTVVPLSEVNDPVFAEEMMGKGAAVIPKKGQVLAPCDGEVLTVFRTLHAITIKADTGAEMIIHVGLETVGLNGQYFEAYVTDGARIKKGELLLSFDLDQIKGLGYDVVTPVVITNSVDYHQVEKTKKKEVSNKDLLISLV